MTDHPRPLSWPNNDFDSPLNQPTDGHPRQSDATNHAFQAIRDRLPAEWRHPIPPPLLNGSAEVLKQKGVTEVAHDTLTHQLHFLAEIGQYPDKIELLTKLANHLMVEYPGLLPRLTAFVQEINPQASRY
jgi:hypothetical protein